MKLHELSKPIGSTKNTKRKGRGTATGQGKTGRQRYERSELQKRRRCKTGLRRRSRCRYTEESRREGSPMSSRKNGPSVNVSDLNMLRGRYRNHTGTSGKRR